MKNKQQMSHILMIVITNLKENSSTSFHHYQ